MEAVEELEVAYERLEATAAELRAAKEELECRNEALETAGEEMRALNEALHEANAELRRKVEELSRARDDLNNLLCAVDLAILFLDSDLRLARFTEKAAEWIGVAAADLGRPIGELAAPLQGELLAEAAREVLDTLDAREIEVPSGVGTRVRILPYRTTYNVIDGLIIAVLDAGADQGQQSRRESLGDT